MKKIFCVFGVLILALLMGCQHAPRRHDAAISKQDEMIYSIGKVTEGLTQTDISREDLVRLGKQISQDPEAKSAVASVNQAMQVQKKGIRYCPNDGKRFSDRVKKCPVCGATLKDLD